jgi:GWxTD domain-containing protein
MSLSKSAPRALGVVLPAVAYAVACAVACALACLLAARPAAAKESQYEINIDKPTKEWREGPVRYIITKEEDKTYKQLDTEQERANFIDLFWRRRDPTPRTDFNEFKNRFRNRCLDANRLYSETSTPGWKTDMGKISILLGPPDEMVRDRVARGQRGTVIWIYRQPPFPDLPPNTVIAFAKGVQGDYELSTRPTWDSDVAHGLQFMGDKPTDPEYNVRIFDNKDPLLLAQGVPYSQDDFETGFIYSRVQTMPPRDEAILHDVVVTKSTFEAFPFKSRYSFFKTQSGETLVAVTLALKTTSVLYHSVGGKDRPDVGLFGKLVDQDVAGHEVPISSEGSFAAAPQNDKAGIDDYLIYQALVPVPPGRYQAVYGADDRVAGKVGTFREPLVVPDLSKNDTLMLSSLTVAESVGSHTPVEGEKPSPFVLGSLEVVQAPEPVFKPKESLNFYYQVYNVKRDPATNKPILDIDYDYFVKELDRDVKLGTIHVGPTAAQVQAYSLPLERFPTGEYELKVTVTDKVAGTQVEQHLTFSVMP